MPQQRLSDFMGAWRIRVNRRLRFWILKTIPGGQKALPCPKAWVHFPEGLQSWPWGRVIPIIPLKKQQS
jgi:hypothetical protein